MPKTIRVEFTGFSGDFDETVGANGITIQGEIFGITFDGAPEQRTNIFTFSNEPITVRHK